MNGEPNETGDDSAPEPDVIDVNAREVGPSTENAALSVMLMQQGKMIEKMDEQIVALHNVGALLEEWLPRIFAVMALESSEAREAASDIGDAAKTLLANEEEAIATSFTEVDEEGGDDEPHLSRMPRDTDDDESDSEVMNN